MDTLNETSDFAKKVVFVTGAGSGIGRATALAFARAGASVVLTGISEPGLQASARLNEKSGGRALALKCDVLDSEDVRSALDKMIAAFGRLDFAFNNAGVEQPVTGAADITEEEWERIVNVNLRGECESRTGARDVDVRCGAAP